MNLKNLFELQKQLNEEIDYNQELSDYVISRRKMLALHVEIGELANETRCFKYWSNKKPSPKKVILEEYVDALHFILTLGLDRDYTDIDLNPKDSEYCLTDQFLNLYIDINDMMITASKDHYITLFEDFLTLGMSLGFSDAEIEEAYLKKNKINHIRQANGY